MSRKRRLRIVMGEDREVTANHAKALLRAFERYEMKHPDRVTPRGIAQHVAHYPLLCDDCNQTFWSRDPYSAHFACKGAPKSFGAGFQQ